MQTRLSKNQIRKRRRRRYHEAINELAHNPADPEALATLQQLFTQYFRQMDIRIDGLSAFPDTSGTTEEWRLINEIIQDMDANGWIAIPTEGGICQLKAGIQDYIKQCAAAAGQAAKIRENAARSLHERAVKAIQPRHN